LAKARPHLDETGVEQVFDEGLVEGQEPGVVDPHARPQQRQTLRLHLRHACREKGLRMG
jgi:hypothetical protein